MELQHTPNQLSRRNWIRDAALTATSAVVLPSLLTGCDDHRLDPLKGGLQDVPLTSAELAMAATNLINMNTWIENLYLYTSNYEIDVLTLLKSGGIPQPSGYKDFILSILTDIAIGIIGVAAAGVPGLGPAVGAGVALVSLNIKTWALDKNTRPANLNEVFAEFKIGQDNMQLAISSMLLRLSDPKDNYSNLREGWKGEIDFNGKKYTLRDLANSKFPFVDAANPNNSMGVAFDDLRTAALNQFKRYIWNVMIAKAGTINYSEWSILRGRISGTPRDFGKNDFYTKDDQKANYLRGYQWRSPFLNDDYFYFSNWYFTFDGRVLPAAAAKILFKDDVPGNIINPDGLFARDYVFKQFHTERISFQGYHDVRKDDGFGPAPLGTDCYGFDCPDDFEFNGGEFPQLKKK